MRSLIPTHFHLGLLLAGGLATADAMDRFVSLEGGHVPPFASWADAATNIQAAIDAASAGDTVWVTNGVYATGGKAVAGALTNRVALDKALLVRSVNGPQVTIIQGAWDPATTNGPLAVRCAWLTNGATLNGFTLRRGATLTNIFGYDGSGGGAFCSSTNSELADCVVTNCRAWTSGGGVQFGLVRNCELVGNSVAHDTFFPRGGGGAHDCTLVNCIIRRNTSWRRGGGASDSRLFHCAVTENATGGLGGGVNGDSLIHCTVAANTASSAGGGVSGAYMTNCIVYLNSAPDSPNVAYPLTTKFTCSTPLLVGTGNIADDPQLTDGWHLAATSPCRGMGAAAAATGADLDGDPWANPPSIGCDEVNDAAFVGPLSVSLTAAYPEVATSGSLPLLGRISGRAASVEWSFGDGPSQTNLSALTFHSWADPGDYLVTFTAYNADNPGGVSTNLPVHVVPLVAPSLAPAGLNGTSFTLNVSGQPGITYVVEQTTNLAPPTTWQTVQALISTGAVTQVTDSKATNAMRFYRTRMQ